MSNFVFFFGSYVIFLATIGYGVRKWSRRGQVLAAIVATAIFAVGSGFAADFYRGFVDGYNAAREADTLKAPEVHKDFEEVAEKICCLLRREDLRDGEDLDTLVAPDVRRVAFEEFAWPGKFWVSGSGIHPDLGLVEVHVTYHEYDPDTGWVRMDLEFTFNTDKQLVGIKWTRPVKATSEDVDHTLNKSLWYND